MKLKHEQIQVQYFNISNELASRIVALSAGTAIGTIIGSTIHQLIEAARLFVDDTSKKNTIEQFQNEMFKRLEKIRPGGILVGVKGNDMTALGLFISKLFIAADWKVRQGNGSGVPAEQGICFMFALEDSDWFSEEPSTTLGILVSKFGFKAIGNARTMGPINDPPRIVIPERRVIPPKAFRDRAGAFILLLQMTGSIRADNHIGGIAGFSISALSSNDVAFGSWLCENHSAGHPGARLIRRECRSRLKDSSRLPVRFLCCALTTASSVFAQPRLWAAVGRRAPSVRSNFSTGYHGKRPLACSFVQCSRVLKHAISD